MVVAGCVDSAIAVLSTSLVALLPVMSLLIVGTGVFGATSLEDFALGGQKNAQGLPVYIRFRMTSDANGTPGGAAGWYIDNVVVSNLDVTSCPPFNLFQPGDVLEGQPSPSS